jgi:hypothetical protein
MSEPDAAAEAVQGEVVEPSTEVAERPEAITAAPLPEGVRPSPNYMRAIELGHVLAKSGFYADARDPAKAAVKVMIGMDLGISPTAAIQGIHTREDSGKIAFIIESKLLGSVIKQRDGYDYKVVERTAENCILRFFKDGKAVDDDEGLAGPDVSFSKEDADRADLTGPTRSGKPGMYDKYPEEMLFWRCLAKGIRIHFPELMAGQPVYVDAEMGEDSDSLKRALEPAPAPPLSDAKAENLREKARAAYDELKEINAERVPPGRFASMVKGAEHSHAQLEGVVEALEDLRDTEKRIVELLGEIEPKIPADAFKALKGRVERLGSNRARVEALEEALEAAGGDDTNEKEESDGSNDKD